MSCPQQPSLDVDLDDLEQQLDDLASMFHSSFGISTNNTPSVSQSTSCQTINASSNYNHTKTVNNVLNQSYTPHPRSELQLQQSCLTTFHTPQPQSLAPCLENSPFKSTLSHSGQQFPIVSNLSQNIGKPPHNLPCTATLSASTNQAKKSRSQFVFMPQQPKQPTPTISNSQIKLQNNMDQIRQNNQDDINVDQQHQNQLLQQQCQFKEAQNQNNQSRKQPQSQPKPSNSRTIQPLPPAPSRFNKTTSISTQPPVKPVHAQKPKSIEPSIRSKSSPNKIRCTPIKSQPLPRNATVIIVSERKRRPPKSPYRRLNIAEMRAHAKNVSGGRNDSIIFTFDVDDHGETDYANINAQNCCIAPNMPSLESSGVSHGNSYNLDINFLQRANDGQHRDEHCETGLNPQNLDDHDNDSGPFHVAYNTIDPLNTTVTLNNQLVLQDVFNSMRTPTKSHSRQCHPETPTFQTPIRSTHLSSDYEALVQQYGDDNGDYTYNDNHEGYTIHMTYQQLNQVRRSARKSLHGMRATLKPMLDQYQQQHQPTFDPSIKSLEQPHFENNCNLLHLSSSRSHYHNLNQHNSLEEADFVNPATPLKIADHQLFSLSTRTPSHQTIIVPNQLPPPPPSIPLPLTPLSKSGLAPVFLKIERRRRQAEWDREDRQRKKELQVRQRQLEAIQPQGPELANTSNNINYNSIYPQERRNVNQLVTNNKTSGRK